MSKAEGQPSLFITHAMGVALRGVRRPRPDDRTLSAALVAITVVAAGMAVLLVVDYASPGDDPRLHQLSGLGLLAICAVALTGYRVLAGRSRAALARRRHLEQLTLDKRAAEAANHAKSRYLSSISHEIRSPLNAIYGYAQLVERDDGIDPREAAAVIRRCAEHLNSLVEGLLDISQVEHGVLRVKPDVVRLAPFLDQIMWMFRPAAAAKGLTFEFEAGPLPPFVRMDQSRLRQVLINLLSNAIKFTAAGTVKLRVSYSGEIARFEITDTGPGIPAADRERIFDPFERGQMEAQAALPGVGLGLPIARAMIEILGGQLELSSQPGEGTTFKVTIMLPSVAGKLDHKTAVRHVTGYQGARRAVLVADDDPEQLAFLAHLLESLGFDVTAVPNGETALARCQNGHFDLAILDITMPGISGWDTAVQLRERLKLDLRIMMLSANSQEFHKPDFPRPVHDMFVVKPVEFGALVEAIGGLLNLSWTWQETAPAVVPQPSAATAEFNDEARRRVARIGELLRIGHVRGLEQEIGELDAADPRAQPLAARLLVSLDRFDLAGMARELEQS
jgi:signal transduction histidine kinase/DNA-binding NarL/FixJ family response regulator